MSGEDLVERPLYPLPQGENFLGLTLFFLDIAILFFYCDDWISSHDRSLLKLQGVHAEGYHHGSNSSAPQRCRARRGSQLTPNSKELSRINFRFAARVVPHGEARHYPNR